ncbi:MAG: hypothetical protein ACLU8Y_07970 [Clostridia bacterium]|jgi:mRNA-degrading endonuclease RelE of RelBE toxin-antitoxin system
MDIRKDIIDKYLNTKKNRLIAGCVTGLIVLGCGGGIVYATRDTSPKLQLKKNTINLEYGKEFKADFDTLVDTKGLNKEDKEYLKKNLKIKSDIKNDTESVTKEDGTTEEKDRGFAKVGDYKVNLTYKDETKTVKVVVKDTTAPEITVPENIEILQGTDLSTFDFKSLITATDLAQMELNIDYSTINVNVPMEYIAKANVEDVNGNKNEKEFKVTVIALPIVAEDEVVVQETVTNADGTKTVKNTVKKKADSSGNKVVSSGNNSNSSSNSSGNKPSGSAGTGGSSGSSGSGSNKPSNGGTSGGSSSGGNSGNSGGSSGSGSGNTGGNSGSTGETIKKYIYVEWSYKVGDRTFNGSWAGREEKWNPNAMSLPNDAYDFSGFNKKSITYEEYKQIMGY